MSNKHERRLPKSLFTKTNMFFTVAFLAIILLGSNFYILPRLDNARNSYVVAIAAGYHASQEAHLGVFGKYALPNEEIGIAFPADISAFYDRASMPEGLKKYLPRVEPKIDSNTYLIVLVWRREFSQRVWVLISKDTTEYIGELPIDVKH